MNNLHKLQVVISITFLSLIWSACDTDFLDKEPVDVLSESIILSDNSAYQAQLVYLYLALPLENFGRRGTFSYYTERQLLSQYTDELVSSTADMPAYTSVDVNIDWFVDGYKLIRALNNLIAKIPESTIFNSEKEMKEALGELKFMRAFAYFNLAKRYGGVPIITEVAELPNSNDFSELFEPRDTESDVFKFIENEMDAAVSMLPEKNDVFRFNKWSALSFKSRAMLHAASIAKYGELQLDGVVGIPTTESDHYWEAARNAAKNVIENGPYSLYNESENKTENYHLLFFDETSTNKERIFVEAYVWPDKGHSFDRYTAPYSHRSGQGYGGLYNPTLRMVESYEYVDNLDGSLKLLNDDGTPVVYSNPEDLFAGKDPRFFQSVLFPGASWMGTKLDIYANVIEGGELKEGYGPDGILQPSEATSNGFYLSKWANPTPPRPIDGGASDVDRIIIRYAEVLLNYSEAELELGNAIPASMYVNMIRERAGLKPYETPITMEQYRHERKIELAFEGNRYWDMKRWRVYHEIVYDLRAYSLWPIKNLDNGTYEFKTKMLPNNIYTRTFDPKLYYYKIDSKTIESNPLIIQNPGY